MSSLVPCPSCARHVRVSEAACPFCRDRLPDLTPRIIPAARRRLDRLAAFTFAAGLAVIGCGSEAGTESLKQEQRSGVEGKADPKAPNDTDDGKDDDDGAVQPMYGAPAIDAGPGPVDDGGGIQPMYGAPADDGGFQAMYGMPVDAGAPHDDGGVHAMYGLPPHNE